MAQEPDIDTIRRTAHFLVAAPADFVCGFTEKAKKHIADSGMPCAVFKTADLTKLEFPAFPGQVVDVMQGMCERITCNSDLDGDPLLQSKIKAGYPQVFLYDPATNMYDHVGHWGDLSQNFKHLVDKMTATNASRQPSFDEYKAKKRTLATESQDTSVHPEAYEEWKRSQRAEPPSFYSY